MGDPRKQTPWLVIVVLCCLGGLYAAIIARPTAKKNLVKMRELS